MTIVIDRPQTSAKKSKTKPKPRTYSGEPSYRGLTDAGDMYVRLTAALEQVVWLHPTTGAIVRYEQRERPNLTT